MSLLVGKMMSAMFYEDYILSDITNVVTEYTPFIEIENSIVCAFDADKRKGCEFIYKDGWISFTAKGGTLLKDEGFDILDASIYVFFKFLEQFKPNAVKIKNDVFLLKDLVNNAFFQNKLNSLGYSNLELKDGVYITKLKG